MTDQRSSTNNNNQRQHRPVHSVGRSVGGSGGEGTWQSSYLQHQSQLASPLSPGATLHMDSSLDYGRNLDSNNFFQTPPLSMGNNSDYELTNFDHYKGLAAQESDILDNNSSLLNFTHLVPALNVNRNTTTFTDNSPPPWLFLSPIHTDVHPDNSPAFSTPSQMSDSSHGFLSPRQSDPMTPSPTIHEHSLVPMPIRPDLYSRYGSASPITGSLGLSFGKMHFPPDQSPGPSGSRTSFTFPSPVSPNSSGSDTFPFYPSTPGWPDVSSLSMTVHNDGLSSGSSDGTSHPHQLGVPSSAPTSPVYSMALISGDKQAYGHAEQYQFWKDVPMTSHVAGNLRLFVPQRMYRPHTGSDRRRYVEEVQLSPPIMFDVHQPSECGIPLDDALKCRTKRLVDRDSLMFEGCGPSVSIRLEWPGSPWSRQIPTKDFRSPPGPITKAKLAKNIAKCVQRFIQDTQGKPLLDAEDPNGARFKVGSGPNRVRLEDLILVSLHHVSQGSWQPHLRLRRAI